MRAVNLVKALRPYKTGWVAIDEKQEVVVHAKDFKTISEKVNNQENIVLIPASENYFGFVT